ncbi:MAG: exodeoxyribonuclease III [Phycisphaerae bacterium]|jgi:exodeoxyribonuclease-3|nr:exodeoxyribonuclease III [Phycisphaerae bacterium]
MKIATWNVNSIRVRLEQLGKWLDKQRPDVLCLQELKAVDEAFPFDAIKEAGYFAAVHGQKTYNGVAILSRIKPVDVRRGMGADAGDPQARLVSAKIGGAAVLNAYFPNGGTVGSESFAYKLDWMRRLREYLRKHFSPSEPLALCGDFNVAIDDKDVNRPEEWADTVLCHQDARNGLAEIRRWGLVDVFRRHQPQCGIYSWWDYRQLGFPRNNGLRIDHIYATKSLADRSTAAEVDCDERKGQKPSDHAPVIAVFED